MAITVTIDDLNIPENLKSDPVIIQEVNKIIIEVQKIVFMPFKFTDADMNAAAKEDFKQIIIWESEARFFFRNTTSGTKPTHGGLFYSSEAYISWNEYVF